MLSIASNVKNATLRFRASVYSNRIIFHHIPKCGGSAITRPIRLKSFLSYKKIDEDAVQNSIVAEDSIPFMERHDAAHKFKTILARYLAEQDIALIQGHIPYFETYSQVELEKFARVTVVREPLQRFLSHFFWDKCRLNKNGIFVELPEFLETEQAQAFGSMMLRYLSGAEWPINDIPSALELARQNAKKFDVIGRLDDIESFKEKMHSRFNWKLNIPVSNVGTEQDYAGLLERSGTSLINKLQKTCEPDTRLFELLLQEKLI